MSRFLARIAPKLMDPVSLNLSRPGVYSFLNPHTYMVHRSAGTPLQELDGIMVDGLSLALALRLGRVRKVQRASFDMGSLAPVVLEHAVRTESPVYFVGTRPDLLSSALQNIRERYPGLLVAGSRHGYFSSSQERENVVAGIVELNPPVVVAGMGAPLQERFLMELAERSWCGLGFSCGGFLHQTAKGIDAYPPPLANRLHLRWAVRMLNEPGVFGRVLRRYPTFVPAFLRDVAALRASG